MERQSTKKIEGFVCSVFLEILEVTSLSARLLRQTLKTSFKAKKWGPLLFEEGFYIILSLANPIRFPNKIPGDLTVCNTRRKIYSNWIWLFSRAHSIGSIYLNKTLTQKLGINSQKLIGSYSHLSKQTNKQTNKINEAATTVLLMTVSMRTETVSILLTTVYVSCSQHGAPHRVEAHWVAGWWKNQWVNEMDLCNSSHQSLFINGSTPPKAEFMFYLFNSFIET